MGKRSPKVYVPESKKDQKYWEKRRKNNEYARKCRDRKKTDEQRQKQIFRLMENEVINLKEDCQKLKLKVQKLEIENEKLRLLEEGRLFQF